MQSAAVPSSLSDRTSRPSSASGLSDAAAVVRQHVQREVQAIVTRVDRLLPFSSTMTMVPAAAVPLKAMALIERQQRTARVELRRRAAAFFRWLQSPSGRSATAIQLQNQFVILKLRFNAVLSQFDIFADVLVQRSELGTGLWIAGLDDLAADSLRLGQHVFEAPEMVCYLDRGHGAAIRRARTQLPGGDENPVAIIRIPRERMVGLGIGASLVHEVGHQADALLNLVPPVVEAIRQRQSQSSSLEQLAWVCWQRWISEIVPDLWAVGHLGITATYGLMGVVGLPRFFMFQVSLEGPHPFPWIRTLVSIAFGRRLYPDPQWDRVESMWRAMYPPQNLDSETAAIVQALQRTLPELVDLVLSLRPGLLQGQSLANAFRQQGRSAVQLRQAWARYQHQPQRLHELRPTLAFAAIGQARVDGRISPQAESRIISRLLLDWAVKTSLTGRRLLAASAVTPAVLDNPPVSSAGTALQMR